MLEERTGLIWQAGATSKTTDSVAAEAVRELLLDGARVSRNIVSPVLLKEWGAGHVICEGWLSAADIAGVEAEGERIEVTSRSGSPPARNLVQRTSGYLGREGGESLLPLTSSVQISPDRIQAWAGSLSELGTGWRQTGGLHVALLFDEAGQLVALAEDVGRHNALDKVVGAAYFQGVDCSRCAVVLSGRMPEGMIAKVVRAGIPIAVSKAASTSLGIDTARRLNLTLICFARSGRFTIYSGEDRVLP